MHIVVLQENLKRGLTTASRAVAVKSTMPILSNVLLSTEDGMLKIAGTNLAIGITCEIGAKIIQKGAITVPAKLFSDIIGGLPNDPVELIGDDVHQSLQINCAGFKTNIKGIDADEYPSIPVVEDILPIATMPGKVLKEAIDQVSIAAAEEDTRPVLSGVRLQITNNSIELAAADGFRLAVRHIDVRGQSSEPIELIVPVQALIELARVIDDEIDVGVYAAMNAALVSFKTGSTVLSSRLIEGRFPSFEQFVNAEYAARAVMSTGELTRAVKLAAYVASTAANIVRLTFNPDSGQLTITTNATEVGDNEGIVSGIIDGSHAHIALNVKLLAEAISTIKTPEVTIELLDDRHPAVFRPASPNGLTQVVMPMMYKRQS